MLPQEFPKEYMDILKKIAQIAALAGINGQINQKNGTFMAGMQLGHRSQMVHARPSGRNFKDAAIITVFSPCLEVKKGFMKGISKEMALELLRLNEETPFARFSIWDSDDANLIVASADHLLDSLDPDDFESLFIHVAIAADQYEAKYGKDEF